LRFQFGDFVGSTMCFRLRMTFISSDVILYSLPTLMFNAMLSPLLTVDALDGDAENVKRFYDCGRLLIVYTSRSGAFKIIVQISQSLFGRSLDFVAYD